MTLKELKALKRGQVIVYGQNHYKIVAIIAEECSNETGRRGENPTVRVRDLVQLTGTDAVFNRDVIMPISVYDRFFGKLDISEEEVKVHFAEYLI